MAFRALADAGRRAMVSRLAAGPAPLGELARPMRMSLPAVQQHLALLEQAGLVATTKVGRQRLCRLQGETLREVEIWLAERRLGWNRKLDRLEAHLGKETEDDPDTRHD
jgi:DNA-binding transcriptional ArsR family regulator